MVADSDLAIGQILDTISHSPIWESSAVFIVEDDSQDGADHVNAHRIPVAVVSPYAKLGAVVAHALRPALGRPFRRAARRARSRSPSGDALAVPMYDAFSPTIVNAAPISAITPSVDLLERNTATSPDAEWSTALPLDGPDQVSQATLDRIIWHGGPRRRGAQPPPVGPGASGEDEEQEADGSTTASGPTDDD